MTIPYMTGTVSVPAGGKTVTGAGTAWATALIVGGVFFCNGLAIPIANIDSDTQLTLALAWPAAAVNAKPYAIVRDTDYARQSVANATALAEYIRRLDNETLQAMASIIAPAGKESLPLLLGEGSATVLPLADLLTRLGVSDFAKTLLDDGDAATARETLGISEQVIARGNAAGKSSFALDLPTAYSAFRLIILDENHNSINPMFFIVSENAGASYFAAADDYQEQSEIITGTTSVIATGPTGGVQLVATVSNAAGRAFVTCDIDPGSGSQMASFLTRSKWLNSQGTFRSGTFAAARKAPGRISNLLVFPGSGNFLTCNYLLIGIR